MTPKRTKSANSTRGIDLAKQVDELRTLIRVLREEGVARIQSGDLAIELGPMVPPRSMEDFAIPGMDEAPIEDDGRFDHVAIRLREPEVES